MAALESAEVYIPQDACVINVRLQDLPSSISRKMGIYLGVSEDKRSGGSSPPVATWICPVELRVGAAESSAEARLSYTTLLPLEGQVCLPVVSSNLLAHQLLQQALICTDRSHSSAGLHGGITPGFCNKVPAGRKNTIILYDGQIFLSLRKPKNQQGRGLRDTIQHNGGTGKAENDGRAEPIREAGSLATVCCVPRVDRDEANVQIQHHEDEAESSVPQDTPASTSIPQKAVCGNEVAIPKCRGTACRGSASYRGGTGGSSSSSTTEPNPEVAVVSEPRGCGSQAAVTGLKRSRGVDSKSRGAKSFRRGHAVHPGVVGARSNDSCGRRSLDGAQHQLQHRVTAGSSTQARHDHREEAVPDHLDSTSPADTIDSYVFEELQKEEKLSQLKERLRVMEAELNKVNSLK